MLLNNDSASTIVKLIPQCMVIDIEPSLNCVPKRVPPWSLAVRLYGLCEVVFSLLSSSVQLETQSILNKTDAKSQRNLRVFTWVYQKQHLFEHSCYWKGLDISGSNLWTIPRKSVFLMCPIYTAGSLKIKYSIML